MIKPQKYLYGEYFQKSLNYLFPLLGISRDQPFAPSTYMWWGEEESIDNNRLLVVYLRTDSILYEPFERNTLLKNPYYEHMYELEDGGKAYVFNLSSIKDTVAKFRAGKYSLFPEGVKKRILTFHGASTDKLPRPGRHIHMSLYPELYYEFVSEEIGVDNLEEVGELMDPPNVAKETTSLKIVKKVGSVSGKRLPLG